MLPGGMNNFSFLERDDKNLGAFLSGEGAMSKNV